MSALRLSSICRGHGKRSAAALRFAIASVVRMLPGLMLAYVIMIFAWPWAALAPLNPIRGLLAFSEFNYSIRTVLTGQVYDMADVPRLYVPIYVMIRVPLLMLFGAALAMISVLWLRGGADADPAAAREIALISLTVIFPLGLRGDLARPGFHRNAPFPVSDPGALRCWRGSVSTGRSRHSDRAVACSSPAGIAVMMTLLALGCGRLWSGCIPTNISCYNSLVGGLERSVKALRSRLLVRQHARGDQSA